MSFRSSINSHIVKNGSLRERERERERERGEREREGEGQREREGEIENEIGRSLLTLNDLLDLIHIVCYHIFAWFVPWQKQATDFILDVTLHFIVHVTSVFLNISSFFIFVWKTLNRKNNGLRHPIFGFW